MAGITVRFDARYLKDEILRVVESKVRAVTNNTMTYEELSWAFQDAMAKVLPVDTGALAYGITGVADNGRTRKGDIHTTTKGLVYNPVELHDKGRDVHYGGYVITPEMVRSASIDPEFIDRATDIIMRGMQNG